MKLYTFQPNPSEKPRIGAELNGQLVDLTAAHAAKHRGETGARFPETMLGLLRSGPAGLQAARELLAYAARRPAVPAGLTLLYDLDSVRVLPPVLRPGKILCSGINYRGHLIENPGAKLPTEPFFFSKLPSTIIGHGDPILLPPHSSQVDYEVEFAVVVGSRMTRTPEHQVMASIAGYTILHDVSARDVQFKDNQITLGKNFDTFCPLGPGLVTTDELAHPENVKLRSVLNGKVMQDGSTSDWVFPLPRLLSFLSSVMTLEPGDVISTGTPAGVGVFQKPPVFLRPGDVVRLEIEGIGALENPVVAGWQNSGKQNDGGKGNHG